MKPGFYWVANPGCDVSWSPARIVEEGGALVAYVPGRDRPICGIAFHLLTIGPRLDPPDLCVQCGGVPGRDCTWGRCKADELRDTIEAPPVGAERTQ